MGALPHIFDKQQREPETFVVPEGWTLERIAAHLNVSVEALIEANRDKLKTWGDVIGFEAGEHLEVPKIRSTESSQSVYDNSSYGQGEESRKQRFDGHPDGLEPQMHHLAEIDDTNAHLIKEQMEHKAAFITDEVETKKILRETALEIINDLGGHISLDTLNIDSQSSLSDLSKTGTLGARVKSDLDLKAGQSSFEKEDFLEKKASERITKEQRKLSLNRIVTTNHGRNVKSGRRDPITKKPSNTGSFVKGETSKGIIPSNRMIRNLEKLKGAFKFMKYLRTAPTGSLFSAVDLAKAYAGQIPLENLSPLSFIELDVKAELDLELLNNTISQGFNATEKLLESGKLDSNIEFVFVGTQEAFKILSGDISSALQLTGLEQGDFRNRDKQYAILVSDLDDLSPIAIFYDPNGFK